MNLQQMAAQRSGAPQQAQSPSGNVVNLGGLLGQRTGGGSPSVLPSSGPSTPSPTPQPGVQGVTPGAIDRKMGAMGGGQPGGGMLDSLMGGGAPQAPSQQAQFAPPPMAVNTPNLAGPARADISAPVGNIENFLRNLQSRNNRDI